MLTCFTAVWCDASYSKSPTTEKHTSGFKSTKWRAKIEFRVFFFTKRGSIQFTAFCCFECLIEDMSSHFQKSTRKACFPKVNFAMLLPAYVFNPGYVMVI